MNAEWSDGLSDSGDTGKNAKVVAIKVAERIANDILHHRPDVLGVLVRERAERRSYEQIAKSQREALTELGAMTHNVRMAVLSRVCREAFSPDLHGQITHDVHAKKPTNLTDDGRRKAMETIRIYEWTPEIDAWLTDLTKTVLYAKQPYSGKPNWNEIARLMKERHGIDLKPTQWMRRASTVKKTADRRKKRNSEV